MYYLTLSNPDDSEEVVKKINGTKEEAIEVFKN